MDQNIRHIFITFVFTDEDTSENLFSTKSNQRALDGIFASMTALSDTQCALKCSRNALCRAFNYKSSDNICEFVDTVTPSIENHNPEWMFNERLCD